MLHHTIQSLQQDIVELKEKQSRDRDAIISVISSLPQNVASEILQRIQVNGANPLTREEVESMLSRATSAIIQQVSSLVSLSVGAAPPQVVAVAAGAGEAPSGSQYLSWWWVHPNDDGQMKVHPCPETFRFPNTSLKDLWILWHFGNQSERMRPYKGLTCGNLFDYKKDKQRLTKCKQLMVELQAIVGEKSLLPPGRQLASLTLQESSELFDTAFEHLLERLYVGASQARKGEQTVNTLYGRLLRTRKAATQ